jgi:SAM-dependent methyltransferase
VTAPTTPNYTAKRSLDLPIEDVQKGNRAWWTANPMAYDWHGEIAAEKFSAEWFDAIDARFLDSARLYATDAQPFDRLIPFERLKGARVLEIGCGMGLHSELMTRAGADVTAIDISPTSVEATRRRLDVKGLTAEIVEGDAVALPFEDDTFDFVWSWGVIHHSAQTARIVRQVHRVLKPGGEARVMVYNREGMVARIVFVRDLLLRGGFRRHSFDELLQQGTDGFHARFYVQDQFEDLWRAFFDDVGSEIVGQDSDAVPLPRGLRARIVPLMPESWLRRAQARRGTFLFLTARSPL